LNANFPYFLSASLKPAIQDPSKIRDLIIYLFVFKFFVLKGVSFYFTIKEFPKFKTYFAPDLSRILPGFRT